MGCVASKEAHYAEPSPPPPSGALEAGTAPPPPSNAPEDTPIPPGKECRLRIFHINDVYLFDNLPALKTCIEERSKDLPRANILTTLAGDFLAPSLLSSIDHGRGMVALMNSLPVDAVCFGNHECDVPHPSLLQRVRGFKGVWLNSNMRSFSKDPGLPAGSCPDNHIVQLDGGRSVGLIGLLVGGGKDAALYRGGAFNGHAQAITPVLDAVDGAVARVRAAQSNLDCVIPLTHQDMPDDVALAGRGHGFPMILGGHDHDVFNELHSGVLIVKAGNRGRGGSCGGGGSGGVVRCLVIAAMTVP